MVLNTWIMYFLFALALVGLFRTLMYSLYEVYWYSKGYKCIEWQDRLIGFGRRCTKWIE